MTMPAISDVTSGQVITAALYNNTKNTIRNHYVANAVETSGNQTVGGVKTFTSAPVCSSGLTVSASGVTVTGNSTITGTLGSLTGITSSGTAALGTVTVSSTLGVTGASTLAAVACTTLNSSGGITGTLQTAAQTNVTSLGTLTALTVSGTLTLSNASPLSLAATSKFVVGATSFSIKDSGDSVGAFVLSGTGTSTSIAIASGSSGAVTVTGASGTSMSMTSSNTRINATNGFIHLGTDGINPIATTSTSGLVCLPYMNGEPTGLIGLLASRGAIVFDDSNDYLAVYTGAGWKRCALVAYP